MILDLRIKSELNKNIYDKLKKISFSIINDFNDLIGIVSEENNNNIDWLISRSASRNTHQSQLFYFYCCIYLVDELIKEGEKIEKIITDSNSFKNILYLIKKKHNVNYEIYFSRSRRSILYHHFFGVIKIFIVNWRNKSFQFKAAKKTAYLSRPLENKNLILIDIFIIEDYISKDRYYNGLWDQLNINEKKRVYFIPTLASIDKKKYNETYKILRNDERNFLFKEDFLSFADLLFSLFHLVRVLFVKIPEVKALDIKFSGLIREELISSQGFINTLEGILNYRFVKKLKKKSIDVSLAIDWWEGQPLDKGWNLGFNKFFPEILTKGYLGYAPREMEIPLLPSNSEIKHKLTPKVISTIGNQYSKNIESKNTLIKVETVPAFRFSHLWKNESKFVKPKNSFRILVALSIMLDESVNILEKVIDSGIIYNKELQFYIKPHPATNIDTIKNNTNKKWPNQLLETDKPTQDCIRKSDLLITGMSSVGLESVVMGIPAIIVEELSGLAYDPIPDSVPTELWRSCRSSKDLLKSLNFFLKRNTNEVILQKKLSEKIKPEYFQPITKNGISKFLELNN